MEPIALEPVDGLRVTILMDNVTDPLLVDVPPVTRTTWAKTLVPDAPKVAARVLTQGESPDALIAEPGFSALFRVAKNGRESTLLFDAGVSPRGVAENMRRLGLPAGEIETIVLSHGHWDHVTGMEGVAKAIGRANLPVTIHPEFWNQRRLNIPGMTPVELPAASKSALEDVGFDIIEERQPSFLLGSSVLVTGEVDRTTDFEVGFRGHEALRDGAWQPDPLILDDQAMIVRLRDTGLVIVSGCGHSGIVNIIRYARKLTGEQRIAAIIGGFHLSGPMFEPIIEPTVTALAEFSPTLLVPAHCTGWKAVHLLAASFPEAFVQCAVGTTIEL